MKRFENELAELHHRTEEMAQLAESMVSLAARAIKNRVACVGDEVELAESKLNQMQMEIDRDAVRILTVYGPVATNLRYILVVNHVTAQLERIGDQVVNICESLDLMQTDLSHQTIPELHKMADLVREVVADAIVAFFGRDPLMAETTRSHDDSVDALNAQIIKKLLSDEFLHEVLKGTKDVADALAEILIARHLERIADQAVNICKEVVYLVHGDDVRHRQKGGAVEP